MLHFVHNNIFFDRFNGLLRKIIRQNFRNVWNLKIIQLEKNSIWTENLFHKGKQ